MKLKKFGKVFATSLPPALAEKCDAEAKKMGVRRSEFIRFSIIQALRNGGFNVT